MWCSDCQQDLPGIASVEDDRLIWCARCNALLTNTSQSEQESNNSSLQGTARNSWRDSPMTMGLDYLSANEVPSLEDLKLSAVRSAFKSPVHNLREVEATEKSSRPFHRLGVVGWTCVSIGLLGNLLSAVVMGWSLRSGSSHLWLAGQVMFFTSQLSLLLGLLFHLDCIWQRQRSAESSLRQLTGQLSWFQEVVQRLPVSDQSPEFREVPEVSEGAVSETLREVWREEWEILTEGAEKREAA